MEILTSFYLILTKDTLFDTVKFQRRYRKNPFSLGDTYLMRVVDFCTTHGQNNSHKFDTGDLVPVKNLNGVVVSTFLFTRSLIDRTGKI